MKYKIVSLIGALVIAGCCVLSCVNPVAPETEPYNDVPYIEDIVIVEPTRIIVRAEIQRSKPDPQGERSGMMCDMYEGETDEPETVEEVQAEAPTGCVPMDSNTLDETNATIAESVRAYTAPSPVETVQETQAYTETQPTEPVSQSPQEILLNALRAANIEFWYPYACAQIQQESHWNPWAENPNGLDKGLLQYRITFWTEPESIFDVNAQIRKYVGQVAARIAAGLSIEEIISRHITSDYVTEINWEYVNHVLSWMN